MKSVLMLVVLMWLSGCTEKVEEPKELSAMELQAWSKALEFPKYCEEGAFEGDSNRPNLQFFPLNNERIVSVMCESFAYQNVANLYRVQELPNSAKVINLLQVELDLRSLDYYDDNDQPLTMPSFEVSFFRSAQVIHKSITQLPNKKLQIVRLYNQDGKCGSSTLYDFDQDPVTITSLQMQVDCESDTITKQEDWPYYKVTCQDSNAASCELHKL